MQNEWPQQGSTDAHRIFWFEPLMENWYCVMRPVNLTGALTWNPNGTLQQLAITDPFNSSNTQTCQYQYDAIARLSQANCGTVWGQSFSYDAYGNLTKTVLPGDSGLNWQPGYTNNNQYKLTGVTYDNDGNLTNDTFHTYSWNGLGDLTSIDGNPQYHDALGRLAEWKDDSGTTYELMYAPAGAKIGMMTEQTLAVGRIPLPGGAIASYGSGGLNNYAHADWLGSTRFSSYAATRTMKWDLAHAPYGEVYALTGGGAEFTFTGQFSDYGSTNTLWDFPMREYHSSQGRWISPDPAGLAAVNPMNPQTWNRYAYVGGNPLVFTDPTGLLLWVGGYPGPGGSGSSGGTDCVNPGCSKVLTFRQDRGDTVDCATPPTQPPTSPPTANLTAGIQQGSDKADTAQEVETLPGEGFLLLNSWLYSEFHTGGPQDYKAPYNGKKYVDFGNFNYGAVCGATGFSLTYCQSAAGTALIGGVAWGNTLYYLFGSGNHAVYNGSGVPFISFPFGDQAPDAAQIAKGYVYGKWVKKCKSGG